MVLNPSRAERSAGRENAFRIIFEHNTPGGKAFDVALIAFIIASVVVVMLDSVQSVRLVHGPLLRQLEWGFTILFSVEYVLRLWCARSATRYARSFFGVVDLLALLPTYLSLIFPGGQALLSVRALRLLRVFRVLKLVEYVAEASVLMQALKKSRQKIIVFITAVLTLAVIMGSLMYLVEGAKAGFTSIPRSIYWAIVTLTTVGYGDIAPQSTFGQILAVVLMIMGYGIIAVPTGSVTVELGRASAPVDARHCDGCRTTGHARDAQYCRLCGARLAKLA